MNHTDVAQLIRGLQEKVVLLYAFNATGKTRLSIAYKEETKNQDGTHTGVYYNAYSEDLFGWLNDPKGEDETIRLDIRQSSLNRFHSSLTEDDIREKLSRYRPSYGFEFLQHDNPEDGIKAISFFYDEVNPEDANEVRRVPFKISRGEERIFVWCFFLALFEVDGWADRQSSHFFIDDPVSSLDDHNIFITASTLFDLIEEHFQNRKIIITTHHIGLFAILADWLGKGEKSKMFERKFKVAVLSSKNGEIGLENHRNDVFLYHLRLLQVLQKAHQEEAVEAYHFALLRQVLENIASFLGVGQFSYVLQEIGITDPERIATIVNILAHNKVYYYKGTDVVGDNLKLFTDVFTRVKAKYNFVLHAPAPPAPAPQEAPAQ